MKAIDSFKEMVNKLPINVVSFQETIMFKCNNIPLGLGICIAGIV
jgi:hypothetical protein